MQKANFAYPTYRIHSWNYGLPFLVRDDLQHSQRLILNWDYKLFKYPYSTGDAPVSDIHPIHWFSILGLRGELWNLAIQLYHIHGLSLFNIHMAGGKWLIDACDARGQCIKREYQTAQSVLALAEFIRERATSEAM